MSLDKVIEAILEASKEIDTHTESLFCQGCDTADTHLLNLRDLLDKDVAQKLLEAAIPELKSSAVGLKYFAARQEELVRERDALQGRIDKALEWVDGNSREMRDVPGEEWLCLCSDAAVLKQILAGEAE